ncbi:MAG: hypothetical protein IJL02_02710 [Methanobrevibacter sp.]|uniref:hypothetical protein n=1 Tax=Methanobrevibacter sp. TaxID=66852 RepID=UPI0025E1295C|nr:hypothetical protein [Methanobrevibacter sp.]MBQ6098758.1 hypothetical protein [Methanobrevibacter sp.]
MNNSASSAGAIYCDVNDELTLNNCEFISNTAQEYGGAIMIDEYANITNATFKNNSAGTGGAIYNSGTAKVIMSIFSKNTGYSSVPKLNTNIDIYNNDGSVEDIVIFGANHNIHEKHPTAAWLRDLTESSVLLLTAALTAGAGWGIAANGVAFSGVIAMGTNALIGGVLGGINGLIYTLNYHDKSNFWSFVLKGVAKGIQFSPLGGAINGISPIYSNNFVQIGLTQLISKTTSYGVKVAQSTLNEYVRQSKIHYIV